MIIFLHANFDILRNLYKTFYYYCLLLFSNGVLFHEHPSLFIRRPDRLPARWLVSTSKFGWKCTGEQGPILVIILSEVNNMKKRRGAEKDDLAEFVLNPFSIIKVKLFKKLIIISLANGLHKAKIK